MEKIISLIIFFLIIQCTNITNASINQVEQNQEKLDQSQLNTNGGFEKIYSSNQCIQSFQPSRDKITRIELFISRSLKFDDFRNQLKVSIKESIDTEALTYCKLSAMEIPYYPGNWISIDFPDITVKDHNMYYIVCTTEYCNNESCILWYYSENSLEIDSYSCGEMILKNDIQYEKRSNFDFSFKIFGYGDGDVERWAISMGFGYDACRTDARNLQYILHNNSPEIWPIDHFKVYDKESNALWANILNDLRWIESREDSNDITIWQSAGHGNELGLYDDHSMLLYTYLDKEFDKFDGNLVVTIVACNSNSSHNFLAKNGRIIMTGRSDSLPKILQKNSSNINLMDDGGTYFIRHFVRSEWGYAWYNEKSDTLFGNNDGWISAEEAFNFVLNSYEWPMYDSNGYLYPHISDGIEGEVQINKSPDPNAPSKPDTPNGPNNGKIGITYTYSTSSSSPNNDEIYYLWDWGDGTNTFWIGPYKSGNLCEASHKWNEKKYLNIRVRAKNNNSHLSPWSDSLAINIVKPFTSSYYSKTYGIKQIKKISNPLSITRKILYVGGIGPNNYSNIQEAIENASTYDTIFVYNGIYNENIIINKENILLTGQNRNTTIIDGSKKGDVINIISDQVTIQNFTIQNSGEAEFDAGVKIQSINTKITNLYLTKNHRAIYLEVGSYKTNIIENKIIDNYHGIYSYTGSSNNMISNNIISINERSAIYLYGSDQNSIQKNNISICGNGIVIDIGQQNIINNNNVDNNVYCGILINDNSNNNLVSNNTISRSEKLDAIAIDESSYNEIKNNTIISNNMNGIGLVDSFKNTISYNLIFENNQTGLSLNNNCENNTINYNKIDGNLKANFEIHTYCINNQFYKNNFIRNTNDNFDKGKNSWDYNNKGNYWNDYKQKYPNAKKLLLKGIWDTPYEIPGNGDNQDNFPLIKPFNEPRNKTIYKPLHDILNYDMNLISILQKLLNMF